MRQVKNLAFIIANLALTCGAPAYAQSGCGPCELTYQRERYACASYPNNNYPANCYQQAEINFARCKQSYGCPG